MIDFESEKGFLTDLAAKFAKNSIQKTLLAYLAAIGGFDFFNQYRICSTVKQKLIVRYLSRESIYMQKQNINSLLQI